MLRKHPRGKESIFLLFRGKYYNLPTTCLQNLLMPLEIRYISSSTSLPLLHEPSSFAGFDSCHDSNNLHLDNNLPDTFPKPIYHIFSKPRGSKHQCDFSSSASFVNTSAQFSWVWTFLRDTSPPSITCLTKWYLIAICLVLLW